MQARDHYILKYKVGNSGGGKPNITVDPTERIYTFEFLVALDPSQPVELQTNTANAWSSFAYLEGKVLSGESLLNSANMIFEYKEEGASVWESIAATQDGDKFTAILKGLTPGTTYTYQMKYSDGSDAYESASTVSFTTENTTVLVNGNMDDWYQSGKTWYATSEEYYKANSNRSFWYSSNPGTTTGAGALINKNPTQGNSNVVHTAGGKSAELKSQYASFIGIGKFAAASLYTGRFNSLVGTNGAKIDFGQPFTDRPTQLNGWFRYSTGAMDYVGSNTPESLGVVKNTTLDMCSAYIALTTKTFQVDNTNLSTFVDFDNDEGIVAYGELPISECVSTDGAWKEFTIDLKYRDLTTKPTHIIIVCSASRYGDYFTGSTKSLMYIDDLELIYGDNPILK